MSRADLIFEFQYFKNVGSVQDYDDCEALEGTGNNGFERKTTVSDVNPNKASEIFNMITQMQQNPSGGVSDLPDYENSLQNLLRLDQTLQQLDGLLGNDIRPKLRDRFKKRRLIKHSNSSNSSARAISNTRVNTLLHNMTNDDSNA